MAKKKNEVELTEEVILDESIETKEENEIKEEHVKEVKKTACL